MNYSKTNMLYYYHFYIEIRHFSHYVLSGIVTLWSYFVCLRYSNFLYCLEIYLIPSGVSVLQNHKLNIRPSCLTHCNIVVLSFNLELNKNIIFYFDNNKCNICATKVYPWLFHSVLSTINKIHIFILQRLDRSFDDL